MHASYRNTHAKFNVNWTGSSTVKTFPTNTFLVLRISSFFFFFLQKYLNFIFYDFYERSLTFAIYVDKLHEKYNSRPSYWQTANVLYNEGCYPSRISNLWMYHTCCIAK